MAPCSYVNDATANELGSLLLIKVSLKGMHVPEQRRLSFLSPLRFLLFVEEDRE